MNNAKKLFSSSNGVGRSVRTTLQSFVGILAFCAALIAIPQVQQFILANGVVTAGTLATTIGLVAALQNAVEKFLRDYFGE